jgi:hypothetical protein
MLRLLVLLLALVAAPTAAFAAGGGKSAKPAASHVDLALVGLPIVVDGRAVNYVFLSVRLHVGGGQDVLKLAAQEPYYRDALIRAAHRQPFVKADDWTVVDEARLKAVLLAEARRISGPKAFSRVEIKQQTPRRRAGMKRPQSAARAGPKTL